MPLERRTDKAIVFLTYIDMRILTRDEVRQVQRQAVKQPDVSTLVLMQRAGYAVAQFCSSQFDFASICVVCGKGNNGGKGIVAAEVLRKFGNDVSILILAKDVSELSADAAAMCSHLTVEPIWVADETDFETEAVRQALTSDMIVDAIVGTGFEPPLRGLARKAVHAINSAFGTVVCVDLPSGIESDARTPIHKMQEPAVFAHAIVTFIAPKPAHVFGELTSGAIAVTEMGVQPVLVPNSTGLQVITGQEPGTAFPPRLRNAGKTQFGHVLVVAGSHGKAGAAALAGLAALRTGAGLVTVACPRSIEALVAGFSPELMTHALPEAEDHATSEAEDQLKDLLPGKDAVVLSPGLSHDPKIATFMRKLVAHCHMPLVLHADSFSAFEGRADELKTGGNFRVLTPDTGEAARLIGVSMKDIEMDLLGSARQIANLTRSCVVLTGAKTVVVGASGETWINMTGNSAMAKSSSGYVLSGIIGATLARRMAGSQWLPEDETVVASESVSEKAKSWLQEIYGTDPTEKLKKYQAMQLQLNSECISAFLKDISVAAAVYLHALASDFAVDKLHVNTVLATDLLDCLADAFHDCELQADRALFYLQR